MSDLAQLQSIQSKLLTAIEALSTGEIQSHSMPDGRTVTKKNIDVLWEAYRKVKAEAKSEEVQTTTGGLVNFATFGRPS